MLWHFPPPIHSEGQVSKEYPSLVTVLKLHSWHMKTGCWAWDFLSPESLSFSLLLRTVSRWDTESKEFFCSVLKIMIITWSHPENIKSKELFTQEVPSSHSASPCRQVCTTHIYSGALGWVVPETLLQKGFLAFHVANPATTSRLHSLFQWQWIRWVPLFQSAPLGLLNLWGFEMVCQSSPSRALLSSKH